MSIFSAAQETDYFRGSIPEILLRPARGESSRFPIDTVIGELGQGRASAGAFSFANSVASGLVAGRPGHFALASVNPVLLDEYLASLARIFPGSYRLGGGREEPDGAVSFLVRFLGREFGITGELFIRYVTRQVLSDDGEISFTGNWIFEELILEEARSRGTEWLEPSQRSRLEYLPYERFF
jgi:hypothetical protein